MARTPFPIIPSLCAVAIGYKNRKMIADQVLPRVTVGTREFYYLDFRTIDIFSVPELEVGRKTPPNEVEFGAERKLNNVKDYGLKDRIPEADIDAAAKATYAYDPLARSAQALMQIVALGREIRTARQVFNPATYTNANLKTILTKDTCFANPDTDPIGTVLAMMDLPLQRPNKLVFGQSAWTTLRQHPKVLKACNGSLAADTGAATREGVAALFEVDEIIVGEGWYNIARKGQKPQRVRVWGGHMSAIYQPDAISSPEGEACFGYTAQYGLPWGGNMFDKDIGPQGGEEVRVGETVREMIVGDEFGFFIGNITGKEA